VSLLVFNLCWYSQSSYVRYKNVIAFYKSRVKPFSKKKECWNSISLVNLGNIEIEQIEEIKLHLPQACTPTSTNERPRRTAIRDGPESYPSQKSKKISHKHAET